MLTIVEEGYIDVIKLLITYRARLESRDRDSNTVLLRVLYFRRGIIVERLLATRADISIANSRYKNVGDITRALLEL